MVKSVLRYWYDTASSAWKRPGAVSSGGGGSSSQQTLYIGAFHSPETLTGWNTLESQVGQPLSMRRIYNPNPISGTWSQFDTSTRAHWYSFKGGLTTMRDGGYDTAMTTWLNSVPSTHVLYLSWQHEPENPSKGNDATVFRAGAQHFYTHVKSVRPQTIIAMPVFMDWTHNPSSGRTPLDWYPGDAYTDIIGVDTYNTYLWPMVGSPTKWDYVPLISNPVNQMVGLKNFVAFAQAHSKPWAIGEVASMEHASDSPATRATTSSYKARWISDLHTYASDNGATAVLWFNVYKPADTDPDMLIESSQGSLAAEAQAVTTYGKSV